MNFNLFDWRSLKTRVTFFTLAIFLISVWSLFFYASRMLREDMQRLLSDQQFSAVSVLAAEMNQSLEDRMGALQGVASSIGQVADAAALQARLERSHIVQQLFNGGAFVVRPDGMAVASVPLSADRVGLNYLDRDYILTTLAEDKAMIGKPVVGKALKAPLFVIATPVRDTRGKVIGVLVGAVDLSKPNFLDKVTENRYGKTGDYFIASLRHRLNITTSDKSRIMEPLPAPGINPLIDRFVQGYEGSVRYVNQHGVDMLVSVKGVPVAEWAIVATLPADEAFAPVLEMQRRMLLATVFVTLLLGVLAWVMVRWVLKRQLSPMLAATQTLSALSDSNLPPQALLITSQDEIGELIAGFNRLLETLRQREEALKESEFRWKFAIEGSGDGVWDWNIQTGDALYSRRWKEMLGFAESEISNNASEWSSRVHPEDMPGVMEIIQAHMDGKTPSVAVEFRMLCKDGSWCWTLGRGMVVSRDGEGKPLRLIGTNTDITVLKAHAQQLEHIAHYDALTTLPNRVLFADRLQQAMAQAERRGRALAVAYLDLDGFKAINDYYGHEAGDQLLIALAARMKLALREGDTLARLGGDEFVAILLDLTDVAASEPMLERLLAASARPVHVGDLVLQVSGSIGVTFYPQAEVVDGDQLLRQSDQAMYQAKLAGKNRYHFFDALHDRSVRGHHESLAHIRRALDEHEFVLYYQPKVNMRMGEVIGVEALIRWQHPERGLLPPAVFLPVIENHPLAIELGEWVINSALTQIERWRAAGLDIPVSVNIGARQLQQPDFTERLRALLAAHPAVNPGHLALEVLETSALEDLVQVSQVIEACRDLGVMFALDDFGTGYSSLTYLKRLQVTLLKIDRSFVRDMLDDPDDLAILEGVLGLARAFRRAVIAEGVETVEHGTLLLQLGCELAQGFAIAYPMPAADLPAWVAHWRTDPAWAGRPSVSRDDLPLLYASVEHRAWIYAMESYLKGERQAPPSLDHHQCRFGQWLDAEGLPRYGAQPAFQSIARSHQQVHALALALCKSQAEGRNTEALARLGELHASRDALLEQMKVVVLEKGW